MVGDLDIARAEDPPLRLASPEEWLVRSADEVFAHVPNAKHFQKSWQTNSIICMNSRFLSIVMSTFRTRIPPSGLFAFSLYKAASVGPVQLSVRQISGHPPVLWRFRARVATPNIPQSVRKEGCFHPLFKSKVQENPGAIDFLVWESRKPSTLARRFFVW